MHTQPADALLSAELLNTSTILTEARARARALQGRPDSLPETMAEAYRLQRHSIEKWNDAVAGWKIGGVPPAYADRFADTFLTGPIFRSSVQQVPADGLAMMPIYENGFAAIEPEFIFCLGETESEDRLFIGAEIASSPIPNINDHGPMAVITDFGNNNGLAVGPEIEGWRERDGGAVVRCEIDGQHIAEKTLSDFREHPFKALAFLRQFAAEQGYSLPAGTYVTTGAITGIHEAVAGAKAKINFGAFGQFELELINAEKQ